jgi:mono/diheme cytochrome c family protein
VFAVAVMVSLTGCATPAEAPTNLSSADPGAIARGEYLVTAGNCGSCHTDKAHNATPFAGGRAIRTSFGVYYSSNITPDPRYGIGGWSDADFLRALRFGTAPDGRGYFPTFPFPSFTLMSDRDILDIKAYLSSRPPAATPSKPPEARFPFDSRAMMPLWRWLYFRPGPFVPDLSKNAEWNRGAYLANAVCHCGECHTPRNALGALDQGRAFAGAEDAQTDIHAPNITSDTQRGIGTWSIDDLSSFFVSGMTPSGDFAGGGMAEVIDGTSKLTATDRHALAVYVRSLPPRLAARASGS